MPRIIPAATRTLETSFLLGAFAYSVMVGIIAAQAMLLNANAAVRTLMVANAIGYSVGIAARNAARPVLAVGHSRWRRSSSRACCSPIWPAMFWH